MKEPNKDSNPFLNVLPEFMEWDAFRKAVEVTPELSKEGPITTRLLELNKLSDLFVPLSYSYYFYCKMMMMLNETYSSRSLAEFVSSIMETRRWYDNPAELPKKKKKSVPGLSLIGVNGMGKTTIVEKVFSLLPQVVFHKTLGVKQVLHLKIDCTTKGSTKQICHSFFNELDQIVDENYFGKLGSEPEEKLVIHMSNKSLLHRLGVLVIDEVHNLETANKATRKKIMNFFKELNNRIGIPIVYLGTDLAVPILFEDYQTRGRTQGRGMPPLSNFEQDDEEWKYYLQQLWKHQVLRNSGDLTDELRAAYFQESNGIIRKVNNVHRLAQEIALFQGKEEITTELIAATREQLRAPGDEQFNFQSAIKHADATMTRTHMYNVGGDSKRKLAESAKLESYAKKKWKSVAVSQLKACIDIVMTDFQQMDFEAKKVKLDEGLANLESQDKIVAKKRGAPQGDLIELCRNANSPQDVYDLLRTAGIIRTLDEFLA